MSKGTCNGQVDMLLALGHLQQSKIPLIEQSDAALTMVTTESYTF